MWTQEQQVEEFKPLGGVVPGSIREVAKFQLFDRPAQFAAFMDAPAGAVALPDWAHEYAAAADHLRAQDKIPRLPTPLGMILGEMAAKTARPYGQMLEERRFAAAVIQRARESEPGCPQGVIRFLSTAAWLGGPRALPLALRHRFWDSFTPASPRRLPADLTAGLRKGKELEALGKEELTEILNTYAMMRAKVARDARSDGEEPANEAALAEASDQLVRLENEAALCRQAMAAAAPALAESAEPATPPVSPLGPCRLAMLPPGEGELREAAEDTGKSQRATSPPEPNPPGASLEQAATHLMMGKIRHLCAEKLADLAAAAPLESAAGNPRAARLQHILNAAQPPAAGQGYKSEDIAALREELDAGHPDAAGSASEEAEEEEEPLAICDAEQVGFPEAPRAAGAVPPAQPSTPARRSRAPSPPSSRGKAVVAASTLGQAALLFSAAAGRDGRPAKKKRTG